MSQVDSRDRTLQGTAGVDEAGRGPMIGPLVVCGVLLDDEAIPSLTRLNVRDSKVLTPKRRNELAASVRRIAKKVEIRLVTAAEIDRLRRRGISLNEIEIGQFISVLKKLRPKAAYLDAADVKADRFGDVIGERSGLLARGCRIVSEHKADSRYPIVSAASIVAKEERERVIAELHQVYGDFGSGYPNDPKSVKYVQNLVEQGTSLPPIIRRSWESVRRVLDEAESIQSRLDDD
ncbi:MAG: ribonuclease HII [Candidatus Thorarchaeota archaeon]